MSETGDSTSQTAPKKPHVSSGPGRLIVLSGPSGVGKDTVLLEMFRRDPNLRYSVSYTTRPPRAGEIDGQSYSFVDVDTFGAMAERKEFLEWAPVHDHLYGTSQARVQQALDRGEDIVLKIDVQGADRVRRRVAGEAIFIFLEPPSLDELHRRLVERNTEVGESLALRIRNAEIEMREADKYDHRIINESVANASSEILAIIDSARAAAAGHESA